MAPGKTEILVDFDVVLVFAAGEAGINGSAAELFGEVSDAGINIDLISMTAGERLKNGLSFSVFSRDFSKVLKALAGIKDQTGLQKFRVQSGYGKITLRGSTLPKETGIAAGFFRALQKAEAETPLVSASEESISVLVKAEELDKTLSALETVFPRAEVIYGIEQ